MLGEKSRIQNSKRVHAKMCVLEAKTGRKYTKLKGENGDH